MSHPAFELIRTAAVPTLNLALEEYRHPATGARHFHLSADDNNNAFLVAFLTVPKDSTGVAHILEHTSLCGSRRYPVRDPFFMMSRRSLNTFMNAFTASDWTAYPFASQNRKDYDNLLKVYLDAVFFPNLDELDFAQEGHRVEFQNPEDPDSPLIFKGIVFNEMKGALSSPVQALWQKMHENLYPTITYHYNSGGDPAHIPDLSYDQLREFHRTHYHPSNAVFMTYGNWPAEEHQAHFQAYALQAFQAQPVQFAVPDEQRYAQPLSVETAYALEGEEDPGDKTHVVLGWLLGKSFNPRDQMDASLLDGILFQHSASPLRHALETCDLGAAPSPLCGLDSSPREMGFFAGLEGSNPEQAEAVEKLILATLERIAAEGVPQEQVDAVLHQIELSQREITGDHFPYGLQLLVHALGITLHGGDPLEALHIDPVLEALREDIKHPEFVKGLVRRLLLDNPHRVRLVMAPDKHLSERRAEAEKARLAELKQRLSEADRQHILARAQALEARQQQDNDPEILPKVGLADVPDELKIVQGRRVELAGMPATWFAQGTNGMVYQQIVLDLPPLEDELLDVLPLFCDCLTEVGVGEDDYLRTQNRQAALTGGISARVSLRANVADTQQNKAVLVLAGKALARNHAGLSELLRDTLFDSRFDEPQRLRDLIEQIRSGVDTGIPGRANSLAQTAVTSGMNAVGALSQRWHGVTSIKLLRALDDSLESDEALAQFAARLAAIRDRLRQAPRQFLIIGESSQYAPMARTLESQWQDCPPAAGQERFAPRAAQERVRQAWSIGSQVNFTAKAYATVAYTHADAPVLMVLGDFLRNGYLHRAIREQGGAYGSGAGYDSDTGAFRLFSYRDPHVGESLEAFDAALDWLQNYPHPARALEEAVLGVISRIDRPASPAGEAKIAFFSALHGRTPEARRHFRHQILQVTLEDIKRAAATYLKPAQASIVVLGNARTLDKEAPRFGLAQDSV